MTRWQDLATIRQWEYGTGEPSGAAKTLLAVGKQKFRSKSADQVPVAYEVLC